MNSVRSSGDSDVRTPIDENPDLGRPRSGNGFSHYLVQCRIEQILFANLNTVDACPRGVLDEAGETAPELPAFGDGIEQHGAPACKGPVTTIPDAADLSGMAKATAAGIALNRPGATNYSLVNLTGLLNVAISVWKRFPGRSPGTLLMILMGKCSSRMIRSRELIWLSAQWEKFPWWANGSIRCTKVLKPFSLFFPSRPA